MRHSHQARRASSLLIAVSLTLLAACTREDPVALARLYIQQGETDAALVHLRAAVQAAPDSVELRVMLADMQERKFDQAGAQENLQKALEASDGSLANTLAPRIALLMLDRNELDTVVRQFQSMQLTDAAADSELRGLLALALLGLKRAEAGRSQVLLAKAPAASVNLAKAQLLVLDRKPAEALRLLDLDGAGQAAPWYVLRGGKRIAVEAGEHERALGYIRRAAQAVPWHAGIAGEHGEALVSAGRFAEAKVVFEGLRKAHAGNFWTHYLGALLAQREGRFDEAHALLLRTLRVSPNHLPSLILATSAEINKGELMVAEKRLQGMLQKHPESATVWMQQAQLMWRMGRLPEQARAVKRGLELEPGNPLLLAMRADVEMASGQAKAAVGTLGALLKMQPQNSDIMVRLARARHRAGDTAGAVELVMKAGAADDVKELAAVTRAVSAAIELAGPAKARALADKLVARWPDEPMALLSRAAVQSAQNDLAGARASTLQVLDKQPAHEGALRGLAAITRGPEERKELLNRYQAAMDAGSKSPQTYLEHAALLRGRGAETMAVLERGVQAAPTSVPLREALIGQLLRQGEADKAVTVAQSGATMAGAPATAVNLLASTYERLGKTQQAQETLRKLVADNPQHAEWRLRLARIDAGAGRENEALAQLRALLAERPFDVEVAMLLAGLQVRTDVEAALAVARRLGEQPGLKPAGLLLTGDVLGAAGRTDDALAQFDLAAKAGAGPMATVRIVQLLDRAGRADAAERELEAALRKAPDHVALVSHAVVRAQQNKNPAKALELLTALAARVPNNAYVVNDLAWAQLAAGRPEALTNAKRAAALLPDNPTVLHTLGMALAHAGKGSESVEALRAAANLAPEAPVPRLNLAQQLLATGDKIGAAQALRTLDGSRLPASDRPSLDKLRAELGVS